MKEKYLIFYSLILILFVICKFALNSEWLIGYNRYLFMLTESASIVSFLILIFGGGMLIDAFRKHKNIFILTEGITYLSIEIVNFLIRDSIKVHIFLSIVVGVLILFLIKIKHEKHRNTVGHGNRR